MPDELLREINRGKPIIVSAGGIDNRANIQPLDRLIVPPDSIDLSGRYRNGVPGGEDDPGEPSLAIPFRLQYGFAVRLQWGEGQAMIVVHPK